MPCLLSCTYLLPSLGKLRLKHGLYLRSKLCLPLWPVLEAVDALCCEGNQACAEISGSCGLQIGQAPVLQLLQHTSLRAAVPCPVSLCSCCYAGDAVAFEPGRADDNCLLPLHVHGVGASMASPPSCPASPQQQQLIFVVLACFCPGFLVDSLLAACTGL